MAASILAYALLTSSHIAFANRETFASKYKNGACNRKPRRGRRENTASFSDNHPLRTRLSRVHENWPQLEGNADNHVQGVAEITPKFLRSIKMKGNKVHKKFFYL